MKILITGGSGLLGQYLNIELSKGNEILTLYNSNQGNCFQFNSQKTDLSNKEPVENIFAPFKPDVVVHTAAISRPEIAASLPYDVVYNINVKATENIAELCEKYKCKLIYTSTDLVYNGETGELKKENYTPDPKSLYAETKLLGENKIKETFDDYIILRTSLLYGMGLTHTTNNFHNMLKNLKEGKPVKLFYDQFRTPLALHDAARLINELTQKREIKDDIFNFGGIERVSRLQLGEILCEEAGFDKNLLIKISVSEANKLPPVPDVSMDTSKLQSLGLVPLTIRESIKEILGTID